MRSESRPHEHRGDSARLLLVRHGPGSGRMDDYLGPFLDDLALRAPALRARIDLHATGEPLPSLAGVCGVVFWLADPLRERYPACFAHAARLAAAARERGIRLVNPPEALSNSIKSVQARLWAAAGIPTPTQIPFRDAQELSEILERAPFPALLRADQGHAQDGMRLCASADEIRRLPADTICYPGALAPLVDTRASFRAARPGSPWAEYFHKKRVFVFGDIVRPNHVFFARTPVVGLRTSTFRDYQRVRWRRPLAHARRWRECRTCVRADYAYWAAPPEHPELMRRATRALGLDFVAIDYASFADGRVVLWEANPHFHLHNAGTAPLRRLRRMPLRIASFYDDMRCFLGSLLGGEP